MRKLSALLVLAMLAALFQVSFAAPRAVTMWTFAPNNLAEWSNTKAEIEKRNGITLDISLVPQDAFVTKLQAALMAGSGAPDIIEWLTENNRVFAGDPKNASVVPLEGYAKGSKALAMVLKGRLNTTTINGHIYGLPHDVNEVVFIYNDTLWSKAGVKMDTIKTWDEFFAAAKKLCAEQKDGKPVHFALPSGNGGLGDTMWMIWQQTGASIMDKKGNPIFASAAFESYFKKWKGWYDTGVFTQWDWGNFGALLANGTLASYTSPDWWISQVDTAATNGMWKMKVRNLPEYSKGGPIGSTWGGSFLAIVKGAKDPAQLYKVIEDMQYNKEALMSRFAAGQMIPPVSSVWGDPSFDKPDPRFGGAKLAEIEITSAKNLGMDNRGEFFWQAISEFAKNYSDAMTGKVTIDDACKATDEAVKKMIAGK